MLRRLIVRARHFAQHVTAARVKAPRNTILVVIPGGLEHGGGIGRQMGYFLQAQQAGSTDLHYRVIDSRGPSYINSSPLLACMAIPYLIGAMLAALRARITSPSCIVHVNITGRGSTTRKLLLVTLMRALRMRYVLHLHDHDYAAYYVGKTLLLRRLIASMFRSAEVVIVLGRRDRDWLSRSLAMAERQLLVLHNAVPDPLSNHERPARSVDARHLLFLGHLSARKGVPEFLRALASPAMTQRRWRATLAGGGPVNEFYRLARDLGIADRIHLPGWIEIASVRALCAEADVLVLPSHAEGLAMSVLEAMSHGLAVITTPVGAHLEVIDHNVSGLLVPPGNIGALATALAAVIDDDNLRQRLARGARERFLQDFDVRAYATRLENVHRALLARRPMSIGVGSYHERSREAS
jgi:glycosyltransferase involved in cell wall biosynthesis